MLNDNLTIRRCKKCEGFLTGLESVKDNQTCGKCEQLEFRTKSALKRAKLIGASLSAVTDLSDNVLEYIPLKHNGAAYNIYIFHSRQFNKIGAKVESEGIILYESFANETDRILFLELQKMGIIPKNVQ